MLFDAVLTRLKSSFFKMITQQHYLFYTLQVLANCCCSAALKETFIVIIKFSDNFWSGSTVLHWWKQCAFCGDWWFRLCWLQQFLKCRFCFRRFLLRTAGSWVRCSLLHHVDHLSSVSCLKWASFFHVLKLHCRMVPWTLVENYFGNETAAVLLTSTTGCDQSLMPCSIKKACDMWFLTKVMVLPSFAQTWDSHWIKFTTQNA